MGKLRDKINIAFRCKGVVTEAEKFKQGGNGGWERNQDEIR